MNLHTAVAIADRFAFILPTKKMVDAIYLQVTPSSYPAASASRASDEIHCILLAHNRMIEGQARALGVLLGELVSGDKKDVVMTNRLASHVGRIAIYGWHRGPGQPIQPLSTIHGANYADYSHGIRLVSAMALIDGKLRSIYDILRDSSTAKVLSDEGPIHVNWELLLRPQYSTTIVMASSN